MAGLIPWGFAAWLALTSVSEVAAQGVPSSRVDLLLARGRSALARGHAFEAEGAFRDAIEANPRDVRGYVALAEACLAHDPKRAREVLALATRLLPGDGRVVVLRARLLASEGTPAEARAVLRAHLQRQPNDLATLQYFAEQLEHGGQLSEALACYRRLARAPGATPAQRELGALHARALARMLGPVDRVR